MNKIYRFSFIAIAFIVLLACRNLEESVELALSQGEITVLSAGREGLSPATKTVRQDGGSVLWQAGEAVSVFSGVGSEGGSKYVSTNKEYAEKVELKGPAISSDTDIIWAVYPYSSENSCDGNSIVTIIPAVQKGVDDNFSGNVFPAVAKSNTTELSFRNICGGIKFSVSRDDIMSVTFSGNDGDILAGKVRLIINDQGIPEVKEIIEGALCVTIMAPDGGFFKPGKYYYMSLLPTSLDSGFSIMYRTATHEGTINRVDRKSVKRSIFGILNEHDREVSVWNNSEIDLGLSVNWSPVNLGASSPEEYGGYFAWGETQSNKGSYSWKTYELGYSATGLYKYNDNDKRIILDPEDDAACVLWGEEWRMPTKAELEELVNGCTWTQKTLNGVDGYEGISQSTGNSIFLPMSGAFRESVLKEEGQTGVFWSSNLELDRKSRASSLFMMTSKPPRIGNYGDERQYGYSIRPVTPGIILDQKSISIRVGETATLVANVKGFESNGKTITWISSNNEVATIDSSGCITALSVGSTIISAKCGRKIAKCSVSVLAIDVSSVTLDLSSLTMLIGDSERIVAKVLPENATDKTITWSSSDKTVVDIDQDGKIMACGKGDAIVTASVGDKSTTCDVRVNDYTYIEGDAVDLGLSILWSSTNLGALSPEEKGAYFAWNENKPKYDYSSNRYNYDRIIGLDKLITDAAASRLGNGWRTPLVREWRELINNCDFEDNGNYYLIISRINGNTIYLPKCGRRDGDRIISDYFPEYTYWTANAQYHSYGAGYALPSWPYVFIISLSGEKWYAIKTPIILEGLKLGNSYEIVSVASMGMPIRPVKNKNE